MTTGYVTHRVRQQTKKLAARWVRITRLPLLYFASAMLQRRRRGKRLAQREALGKLEKNV